MEPSRPQRRGAAKAVHFDPRLTSTGLVPNKRKRLSRELNGLMPWSGWKRTSIQRRSREVTPRRAESTSLDEDTTGSSSSAEEATPGDTTTGVSSAQRDKIQKCLENESRRGHLEPKRNTTGQERTVAVENLDGNSDDSETINVVASNGEIDGIRQLEKPADPPLTTPSPGTPDSAISTESLPPYDTINTQSDEDLAALAGPRCPLCMCPINSVNFPVIDCTDCKRTYHKRCICHGQCPRYHPFSSSSIPQAERCAGCGCPQGDDLAVYCGYPGILFHRRDQDPWFEEYLRVGRLEEAMYGDVV